VNPQPILKNASILYLTSSQNQSKLILKQLTTILGHYQSRKYKRYQLIGPCKNIFNRLEINQKERKKKIDVTHNNEGPITKKVHSIFQYQQKPSYEIKSDLFN
jgi:hypothetical protein